LDGLGNSFCTWQASCPILPKLRRIVQIIDHVPRIDVARLWPAAADSVRSQLGEPLRAQELRSGIQWHAMRWRVWLSLPNLGYERGNDGLSFGAGHVKHSDTKQAGHRSAPA
jgi:hypothetical protein